jgi:hypothetical protein
MPVIGQRLSKFRDKSLARAEGAFVAVGKCVKPDPQRSRNIRKSIKLECHRSEDEADAPFVVAPKMDCARKLLPLKSVYPRRIRLCRTGPLPGERDSPLRVVTCRSEFTRPARRSSREQTFAHWRRGMGSQSSFRQPGLAHSVRQKRYRRGDEKSAGNGLLNSASTRRREPRLSNTRSR